MSHNASMQIYYFGLNHNQIPLANGSNAINQISQRCLSVIDQYFQSCDNLSLPIKITLFTECIIKNKIYRCHKCYKGQLPWYDFAMVRWAKHGSEDCNVITIPALRPDEPQDVYLDHHYAPVKLVTFFQSENLPIPYCVVETFEYDHSKISVIGSKWKKCFHGNAASIQVLPCDTIVSHCLMLPTDDSNKEYVHIWEREYWADEFFKC